MTYGEDNVIECKIVKDGNFLHLAETGYGTERDNLDEPDEQDILRDEADEEIARRLREGESYTSIQKQLGVSTKKISRISKIVKSQTDS